MCTLTEVHRIECLASVSQLLDLQFFVGISSRMCLLNGIWGVPVMTACKRSELKALLDEVR